MNKWYQGIVVHHKEIDNKMYHCFDNENFKILTEERNEQLKEIERLNNIIKEVREYITYWHYRNDFRINSFTTGVKEELLEILDKEEVN